MGYRYNRKPKINKETGKILDKKRNESEQKMLKEENDGLLGNDTFRNSRNYFVGARL